MVRYPGGTSESIELWRRNKERIPEEDTRGVEEEYGRKEDADGQREEDDGTRIDFKICGESVDPAPTSEAFTGLQE
ncbi:hypothetical protein NDU88_010834 [Pleurodeles waltl]|uniref:Uncharacterized protein n=1 Tax=Pleurodeles waltl TaxID=8319 RepID=A0AAV7QZB3_PLEWA|nr:hypothetical protein NDU88_010834 [Pleurodeles waltl]